MKPLEQIDDWELLRRHTAGDREAFAELVRRHIRLVHGAARRMLGGPGMEAEDVVQAVFVLLSRKAGRLAAKGALAGWLYRATGYCCRNVRKMEGRRRRHEREAASMRAKAVEVDSGEAAAALDDGLARLGETERQAVLVRYMEGRTANEAGAILGVSEDAAEKRAERGLAKLRRFFAGRGFVVPAGVAALLSAEAAQAAPAGLAARVSSGVASRQVATMVKGAVRTMRWAKMKVAAGVAAMVAAGVVVTAATRGTGSAAATQASAATGAPVPAGRRPMAVRWSVLADGNAEKGLAAVLRAVPHGADGYSVYIGDSAKMRAALAGHVLEMPTFPGWANLNDEMPSKALGQDIGMFQGRFPYFHVVPGRPATVFRVEDSSLGPIKMAVDANAVRLDLSQEVHRLQVSLGAQNQPPAAVNMGFVGQVPTGESVVFVRDAVRTVDAAVTLILVTDVFSANADEYVYLKRISAAMLVTQGVGATEQAADRAMAWGAHGRPDPQKVAPAWERRLKNGAIVRLVGVTRPSEWLGCWWDAEGRAVRWNPRWDTQWGATPWMAAVSVEDPTMEGAQAAATEPAGDFSPRGTWLFMPRLAKPVVTMAVSAGAWTDGGKVEIGEEKNVGGATITVTGIVGRTPRSSSVMWDAKELPEVEAEVVLYDKAGREVGGALPADVQFGPGEQGVMKRERGVEIDAKNVGAIGVKWRRREVVSFSGFAERPAVAP